MKKTLIALSSLILIIAASCADSKKTENVLEGLDYSGIDQDWRIQDTELEKKVTSINRYIDKNKYDMNKDGKVDDKDCSAMFKKRWNDLYPSESTKCRIARIDKDGFMYFFVIVYG